MAPMEYEVRLEPAAERDLRRQVDWLILNRSLEVAVKYKEAIDQFFTVLSAQPHLWPQLIHHGQEVRKAIMDKRRVILYTPDEQQAVVHILAIYGAAEDWTNQPLPTD